jgi:hypothetical protein
VYTVTGVSRNSAFGALAGAFWRRGNDVERIDGKGVWGDTEPSLSLWTLLVQLGWVQAGGCAILCGGVTRLRQGKETAAS